MAAVTADRLGTVKILPKSLLEDYPLASGETLYTHTLALINTDGEAEAATSGGSGVVYYNIEHYDADSLSNLFGSKPGDPAHVRTRHGVVALLNGSGFDTDSVGDAVFVDSNHEVSTSADEATETRPYAGVIQKVITATEALVYIPGLLNTEVTE